MVSLTAQAAEKVAAFKASMDDEATDAVLRLGVVGGGCSGYQYQLALDNPNDDDHVFESFGQKVAVSAETLALVDGSTIVYREDLMQAGFDVENPNATAACGCGSSFRVDGDVCRPADAESAL